MKSIRSWFKNKNYESRLAGTGCPTPDLRVTCKANLKANSKDWILIVTALIMPFVLFLTVIASVGFGVLAAYVAIAGIFLTFGRPSRPEPVPMRPRLVLVPSQNHASGD
jgi:hypothetical protein